MNSDSIPSTRGYDLPQPETGLAEWTSKIKALQRQVDASEEAEQKRLEEEIAASRLARLRRSQGYRNEGGLDISKNIENVHDNVEDYASSSSHEPKDVAERRTIQQDTLRQLTGDSRDHDYSNRSKSQPETKPLSLSQRKEPVSLAAFMGGRATGPRLNRLAPQQDTAGFDKPDTSTPHPVFGRGGIAMPGMVKTGSVPKLVVDPDASERYRPGTFSKAAPVPPVLQKYMGNFDNPATVRKSDAGERERLPLSSSTNEKPSPSFQTQPTSSLNSIPRERTISSPSYLSSTAQSSGTTSRFLPTDAPLRSPGLSLLSETREATFKTESYPASKFPSTPKIAITDSMAGSRGMQDAPSSSVMKKSFSETHFSKQTHGTLRSTTTDTATATPIKLQASIRPTLTVQQSPTAKDPTPSISRLKGRGFVQDMVRASTLLETPPPAPESPEKPRNRKSSVLSRWPNASSDTISSPTRISTRKSTADDSDGGRSPSPSKKHPPPAKSQFHSPAAHIAPIRKSPPADFNYSRSLSPSKKSFTPAVGQSDPAPTYTPAVHKWIPVDTDDTRSSSPSKRSFPPKESTSDPVFRPSERQSPVSSFLPDPSAKPKIASKFSTDNKSSLGSATTMVIIKPDTSSYDRRFSSVDEVGISHDTKLLEREKKHATISSNIPSSGKLLAHPTKDRAKKPRRSKETGLNSPIQRRDQSPPSLQLSAMRPSATSVSGINAVSQTEILTSPRHEDVSPASASTPPLSTVASLKQKYGNAAPIGVKLSSSLLNIEKEQSTPSMVRRALPGLTGPSQRAPQDILEKKSGNEQLGSGSREVLTPKITPSLIESSSAQEKKQAAGSIPSKNTRIPLTGNRATVMAVAQALNDQDPPAEAGDLEISQTNMGSPVASPSEDFTIPTPRIQDRGSALHHGKRKSNYERYSAVVLPSLREEATPTTSPISSVSRKLGQGIEVLKESIISNGEKETSVNTTYANNTLPDSTVHLDGDEPLPEMDLDALILPSQEVFSFPNDAQTIQVEVMSIIGTTASPLSQNTDIFYETEVLLILHRSKSKLTGLVSSTVWAWLGKQSHFSEREERKVQDIARRYGTGVIVVHQFSEPVHLVHVLGGQLTIRHGTRIHWTSENTSLYVIRSTKGVIFIDEHELSRKNLCSGFSYCISILNTVYVWHGRGSTAVERQAALWYAQSLGTNKSAPVELFEGANDDDEIFWMILGDENFADADYWKWRKSSPVTDPTVWRVQASRGSQAVSPVESFSQEKELHSSVYLIDCIWELFVVVGPSARGLRNDIKLALDIAMHCSTKASSLRPYSPTVHVLMLPSQLPLDLKANFRDLGEGIMNLTDIPDHMNILSSSKALDHLKKRVWERDFLNDDSMLLLGLDIPEQ